MASKRNGTLYVGVTNNLERRTYQHKNNLVKGFTEKYNVHKLVYFEETMDINIAIAREKQLKNWKREWKIKLIEKENPKWRDLSEDF
jgi:putative endonuclease